VLTQGKADDTYKASAFPGLGGLVQAGTYLPEMGQRGAGIPVTEAIWWRDFAWWVRQEFIRQAKLKSPNISNVVMAANNGTGDAYGIGTLTITLATY
jgi:hypothetical protein